MTHRYTGHVIHWLPTSWGIQRKQDKWQLLFCLQTTTAAAHKDCVSPLQMTVRSGPHQGAVEVVGLHVLGMPRRRAHAHFLHKFVCSTKSTLGPR
jgi:hypothetical protein